MFPFFSLIKTLPTACLRRFGRSILLLPLLPLLALSSMSAHAQSAQSPSTLDQHTLQTLLHRIDQLEARVRQLEAAQHQPVATNAALEVARQQPASSPSAPAATSAQPSGPATSVSGSAQTTASAQNTTPQEHEAEPSEHAESERMDLSKTLLRIRGFGDVTLHGDNYRPPLSLGLPPSTGFTPDHTAFTLGQLNLFVTSDISDKFKFLSEIVFEAGPDNIYGSQRGTANSFGVDVERYLLTYSANDYFSLSAGRYHTAIGYYNTAYHHSTWLQTTTGRPLLFAFEDQGGILPIHNVGVEAYGRIPSGSLGLHYVAEVGNGRESRNPIGEEPVQNIITDKNHKAFNVAVFARPTNIPGLQTGFSYYHDLLVPITQPVPVSESIFAAHAVYTTANFEWLNEALMVRHTIQGGHTFDTPAFYSQISQRFGSFRPYLRYQYINGSTNEPIFPDIQLRAGPQTGVRYDASESVALKLQYDFTALRNQRATQGVEAQVGFTF
jgi:hypothetical protein